MAVATLVQEAGPRAKLMSAVPNGLADLAEFYGAGKNGAPLHVWVRVV